MGRILVAWLVIAVAGCDDHGKSPCAGTKTFAPLNADDPQVQFQLDRCRADASTCDDVCIAIMMRDMLGGALASCKVTFGSDGKATVKLVYGCTSTQVDAGMFPGPDGSIVIVDAP